MSTLFTPHLLKKPLADRLAGLGLVDWLVGWLIGWLVDWLAWLIGWLRPVVVIVVVVSRIVSRLSLRRAIILPCLAMCLRYRAHIRAVFPFFSNFRPALPPDFLSRESLPNDSTSFPASLPFHHGHPMFFEQ